VLQAAAERTPTGSASSPAMLSDYSLTTAFLDSASKHAMQNIGSTGQSDIWKSSIVTSAEGVYVFASVCLSVHLSVCLSDN